MIGRCFSRTGYVYIVIQRSSERGRWDGIVVRKNDYRDEWRKFTFTKPMLWRPLDSFDNWILPHASDPEITKEEFLEVYKQALEDHMNVVESVL